MLNSLFRVPFWLERNPSLGGVLKNYGLQFDIWVAQTYPYASLMVGKRIAEIAWTHEWLEDVCKVCHIVPHYTVKNKIGKREMKSILHFTCIWP